MRILSIETSCDETGISILEAKGKQFKVLANSLSSQVAIHAQYGGVFPSLAKREHIKNLPILLEKVLSAIGGPASGGKKQPIDLIAVTSGPGLEPALWTGIVFAKNLAKKFKIPLIPVNHMEGHIYSVFAKSKGNFEIPKIKFPTLSLLVSGGHTELVLIKDWPARNATHNVAGGKNYKIIGETLDDAAGEAFDKVARMLGLPYPGGPEISRLASRARILDKRSIAQADGPSIAIRQQANMRAESGQNSGFVLPRPMLHSKNYNFSFSGLKTAVLYLIKKIEPLDEEKNKAIALEFENAVVETLVTKTKRAMEEYKIKTLIVAGGVSSNQHLREEIKKLINKNQTLLFPNKHLSTDNSIMIGIAGYFKYLADKNKKYRIKAEGGLRL